MKKLDMKTIDMIDLNIEKLRSISPSCITEITNEEGETTFAVDFDVFKQEFSKKIVEGPKERYQMTWPGKREALVQANTPIDKTLRPYREESVDFDTTQNLYIEGDNLEALKLLQESYLGKVKMIYIDPPYNTGKDFVYKDNFKRNEEEELEASGQVDEEGGRLVANTESNGRFHSDWLNMIYPRLKVAKNLLKDDGVIFISIDDAEVQNLRKIADEVFGENNFIGQTVRASNSTKNNSNYISITHDYALIYAKSKEFTRKNWQVDKRNVKDFQKIAKRMFKQKLSLDEIESELKSLVKYPKFYDFDHYYYCDDRGVYRTDNAGGVDNGNHTTEIIHPITKKSCKKPVKGWRYNEQTILKMLEENMFHFGKDENTIPLPKRYLNDYLTTVPSGISFFDTQIDTNYFKKIKIPFDFPKPYEYMQYLLQMEGSKDGIILDFFSGSATTAHAVMELNASDGGSRQFIMVQISEDTNEKSTAYKEGYKTVAEIGKERIRRAGKKIKEDNADKEGIEDLDIGFRVLKIDSSNMKEVYYTPDAIDQTQLQGLVGNIKEDRTSEDLLFQVLLDWGVDLTLPIVKESVMGKEVFFVDEDTLAACFDEGINEDFVKELARREVMRVVFKDSGFASDAMKNNVEQIFAQLSPDTEVRAI